MENIFDLISGLPVHPLIDHVVVVFVPLFGLLQILNAFKPAIKEKYGWITVWGLGISFISAVVAEKSGEALAARIGFPGEHAEAGESVVAATAALFFVSLYWIYFTTKQKPFLKIQKTLMPFVGKATAVLAAIAMFITFQAGHTGAKATWENRVSTQVPAADLTTGTVNSDGSAKVLSAQEVALHSSASDCWSIVNGNVYNLTSYVNSHPGGSGNIQSICGKDGTSSFKGQHNGEGKPNNTLSNFLLGALGATVSTSDIQILDSTNNGGGSGYDGDDGDDGDDDDDD